MSMCVYVRARARACVCVDGMNLKCALSWHIHIVFIPYYASVYSQAHTHTHARTYARYLRTANRGSRHSSSCSAQYTGFRCLCLYCVDCHDLVGNVTTYVNFVGDFIH